jgi:CRP-like cAMP-binding protein
MRPSPDQLSTVPLFQELDRGERARVAEWFELRRVRPGTVLCGEGAAGYTFFVLRAGEAVVTAEGEHVRALSPGDFFGEMALFGNGRRTTTVTATSDAELLVLYGTEFRLLQAELPELAAKIERTMAERLTSGSSGE